MRNLQHKQTYSGFISSSTNPVLVLCSSHCLLPSQRSNKCVHVPLRLHAFGFFISGRMSSSQHDVCIIENLPPAPNLTQGICLPSAPDALQSPYSAPSHHIGCFQFSLNL